MNLYMLCNAKIEQNHITHLEWEYKASSSALNLCIGSTTGILVVSDTIKIPQEKSSCTKDEIKYIVPRYIGYVEYYDDWLHFLLQEPLNKRFLEQFSNNVCLCTIAESELSCAAIKFLETVFHAKMVILEAVSTQIENYFRANNWEIAKAVN